MHPNFLSLPPCRRYKRIARLLRTFAVNASILDSPFIILAYGSGSYGFNRKKHGKLDDIDLFLIVPRKMAAEELISFAQRVFLVELEYKQAHLLELLSGNCDICRMYGHVDNVKISFRIMCLDTFCDSCSRNGFSRGLRNIASIGQSRIVSDKEWSMRLGKYIPMIYEHEYAQVESEPVLKVTQYVFSPKWVRLGPVGRKFLTCTPIHDPQKIGTTALEELWKAFVERSRYYRREISAEAMIDSIMRSERFSPKFRAILSAKISGLNRVH